ncbi:hypothetical protein ASPNIDRAFT_43507 [Aspergillus niger ATCC 1015]|uniref:Uncharacterized protein n=1 Tax=Aspergillus niger (strain ATCC 1015 / CBS 113.46 / FGSC A1144 / LSHB Ac4 / NCTC 3858a / NRRL 328 / USDA 3528.7) TaxID=380704 RepID=G3XM69_ASPNA|nr:uncharacterized protein BO96DRAFT_437565 [Aspergillus niger CBS 101883]EHA28182.1 hypothetical protein ASPNIDRAFT_43507 [Aspergillus niger ATCC 1015]PYH52957.1 hypothetical protein BO96DRAFT_437565 [Aspergillus niger CBS 101883]
MTEKCQRKRSRVPYLIGSPAAFSANYSSQAQSAVSSASLVGLSSSPNFGYGKTQTSLLPSQPSAPYSPAEQPPLGQWGITTTISKNTAVGTTMVRRKSTIAAPKPGKGTRPNRKRVEISAMQRSQPSEEPYAIIRGKKLN